MYPDEIQNRQKRLSDKIYFLSKKTLDKENEEHIRVIQELMMIYKDGFRHSYSDFFPILIKIFSDDDEGNESYLLENLQIIREFLEQQYTVGNKDYQVVYSQVIKLCDHLNLQMSQMDYFEQTKGLLQVKSEEMEKVKKALEKATKDADDAGKQLGKARKEAASLKTEMVTVLSIFAAIIMALAGGFNLLGSVIPAICGTDQYEMLVLTTIICGLIIYDTLFLMMYLVGKMTNRNIFSKCKEEECTCEERCWWLRRIRKRLPYVFYFNVLCMLGIVIDCSIWVLDVNGIL